MTAAFNEKLLLGNGLIVSPFRNQGAEHASQPRSLRQAVAAIDNARDFDEFVASQYSKVQPTTEVKYERNPVGQASDDRAMPLLTGRTRSF